jgi:hypothetical protein
MKTVELRHNPFKAETSVAVDGRGIHLNCLGTGEGSYVREWKDDIFSQLIKKINIGPGSACAVVFFGTEEDYALLEQSLKSYAEENKDIKIYFEYGTKPPVTLASKETKVNELIRECMKESPCDILRSMDFSAKVKAIKNMDFPGYLEKAERLCRQTNEYAKLVGSLHLKDEAERQLVQKNLELVKLDADMEECRRLETENAGLRFKEAAEKLEREGKKEVERFFKDVLSETNDAINKMQAETTENTAYRPNPFATLFGSDDVYKLFAQTTDGSTPEAGTVKNSLVKLMKDKINTVIEVPPKIYKNFSFPFMPLTESLVMLPFAEKDTIENFVNNAESDKISETNGSGFGTDFSRAIMGGLFGIVSDPREKILKKEPDPIFDNARTYFTEVLEKAKTYYLAEFDKIINILKKKGEEEKEKQRKALELSQNANHGTRETLEKEIVSIQSRLNWIDDFEKKLNGILDF